MKPDRVHEAVHDEGGPGHVARILEDRHHEEHDDDVGEEKDDVPESVDQAVGEEGPEDVGMDSRNGRGREPEPTLEKAGDPVAETEGDPENRRKHDEEGGNPEPSVEGDGVDDVRNGMAVAPPAVGAIRVELLGIPRQDRDAGRRRVEASGGLGRVVAGSRRLIGGGRDALFGLQRLQGPEVAELAVLRVGPRLEDAGKRVAEHGHRGRSRPSLAEREDGLFQDGNSVPRLRVQRHDLNPKFGGKGGYVDPDSLRSGLVDHREGHDHRIRGQEDLEGEVELPGKVRGVDDIHDEVGMGVHHVVPGDLLLDRVGGKAVGSGEIDDDGASRRLDGFGDDIATIIASAPSTMVRPFCPALIPPFGHQAFLPFDRDAGPVPDMLGGSG